MENNTTTTFTCSDCIFNKYCGIDTKTTQCNEKKTAEDVKADIKRYDESKKNNKRVVKVWRRKR